jgi:hypothetical protein
VFHRSAVSELACPVLDALEDGLLALVRRDLIRPEAPSFAGEKAYRFRHVLIRDAAYRSLPKDVRADLHERFAAWLEVTVKDRLREFEEIVGYHPTGLTRLVRACARGPRLPPGRANGPRRRGGRCPQRPAGGDRLLERVSRLLPTDDHGG